MAFLASLRSTIAYQTNGSTISTGSIFTTIGNVPTWSNQLTYSTLTGSAISTNSLALASTLTGSSIILSGNVGIGSNAPAYTLDLGSNTIGCGAVNTPSITTKGTGNLTVATQSTGLLILNSQGGALALQSGGTTVASVSNASGVTMSNGYQLYFDNATGGQCNIRSDGVGNLYHQVNTTASAIYFSTLNATSMYGSFSNSGLTVTGNNIYTAGTMSLYSGAGSNINLVPSGSAATAFYDAGGTIQIGYFNGAGLTLNSASSRVNFVNSTGNYFNLKGAAGGGTSFLYALYNDSTGVQLTSLAPNAWVSTSDGRLKENIESLPITLPSLLQLRPVSFDFIDQQTGRKCMGLLAQEVGAIPLFSYLPMPNGKIAPDGTDYLSLSYTDFIPYLIKGVQEQHALVVAQEARIVAQQTEIVDLKAQLASKSTRIDSLEAQLSQILQRLAAANIA